MFHIKIMSKNRLSRIILYLVQLKIHIMIIYMKLNIFKENKNWSKY